MTLSELIRTIEKVALSQPSVSLVVRNDIFRLNGKPDARYGVFAWTQGQHQGTLDNGFITYRFTFYYADRLTEDRSNEVEIESVGIQTLDNILRVLEEKDIEVSSPYSFTTFNQRFVDECAGVFVSVDLLAPVTSECGETIMSGDYNDDYNEDFLIF